MPAQQTAAHTNGFDCLRLLAAAAVIFSHSYFILNRDASEPLHAFPCNLNIGVLAVYAFFAISGYLVTFSWQRDPNIKRFMTRRALRLMPALAVLIILTFAVIGPLTTSLTTARYFFSPASWTYLLKILIYPPQIGLPGVFDTNRLPLIVNGSLWSLRVELTLYIAMAIFGAFGLMKHKISGAFLVALCLTAYFIFDHIKILGPLPAHEQTLIFLSNSVSFFTGVALAQNKMTFPKPWLTTFLLIALSVATLPLFEFRYVIIVTIPLLTILAAQNMRCNLSRSGDYSYGLYLWGYVTQQTLVHFFPSISLPALLVSAVIITLMLAAASWHLVEKEALKLKPAAKKKAMVKAG